MKFNALFLAALTAATATVTPALAAKRPLETAIVNHLVLGCESIRLYDQWQLIEQNEAVRQEALDALSRDISNNLHASCAPYDTGMNVVILSENKARNLACIALGPHQWSADGQFSACYWVSREVLLSK